MICRRLGWAACYFFAACAGRQAPPTTPQPEKPAAVAESPIPAAPNPAAAPPAPPVEPLDKHEGTLAETQLCLSCHSAELIQTARIREPAWKAETVKMRNWGARVEEDRVDPLAAWLAVNYPVEEKLPSAKGITAADARAATAPERGAAAIHGNKQMGADGYAKNCAKCHGDAAEGTGAGPVLIEAPVLYQPRRFALLTQKGQGSMPAFPALAKADINNLLEYLRALR